MCQYPTESLTSFYKRVEVLLKKCKTQAEKEYGAADRDEIDEIAVNSFKMGILNPNHKYFLLQDTEQKLGPLEEKVRRLEKSEKFMYMPTIPTVAQPLYSIPGMTSQPFPDNGINFSTMANISNPQNAHLWQMQNPINQLPVAQLVQNPLVTNTTTQNPLGQFNQNQVNQLSTTDTPRLTENINPRSDQGNNNRNNNSNFNRQRDNNAKCNFCGRRGHYTTNCIKKKNTPYCSICRTYGHLQSFCERQLRSNNPNRHNFANPRYNPANQYNNAQPPQRSNYERGYPTNRNNNSQPPQNYSVQRNFGGNNQSPTGGPLPQRNRNNYQRDNRNNQLQNRGPQRNINVTQLEEGLQDEIYCDFCGRDDHVEENCIERERARRIELEEQVSALSLNSENN